MADAGTEAKNRVMRAAHRGSTSLDLSLLDLETLPAQVTRLTHLTELKLNGNCLTSLPEDIGNLTALTILNLGDNELTELPESIEDLVELTALLVNGNRLAALPAGIGGLTRLDHLLLNRNLLTALPESLGRLSALTEVFLSNNLLTALPESFGRLGGLTALNLSSNQLTDLPESFGRLTGLTSLNLGDNRLTRLPAAIERLPNLTELSLSRNQLTELPDSISRLADLRSLELDGNCLTTLPPALGDLPGLRNLGLDANPLSSPPPETCASGTVAVLAYLRALRRGATEQWSSKMLVVGEAAVGKTSVTKALCGLAYDPAEPQTHGVHVDPLSMAHPELPDVTMQLNVWDFGGQLEYRATQRFYFTDRSLFLLVWNSRRGWRAGGQVEAWLQAIANAAPGSPVVIVATHCSESVADLDETDIQRRHPRVVKILRVDCHDGTGIDELRLEIARQAVRLPLMGMLWPTSWTSAARRLAEEPGRCVSTQRAHAVLRQSGLDAPEELQALTSALHDRGEILHFARDPELRDIVVLQPTWVDGMITRVLDSQQVADRGGLLGRAHRAELWADLDSPGLGEMLTALMERFDLAYRTDSPDHEDVALVVERLPAGAPARLPSEWTQALEVPGTSELRVTYRLASRQAGVPSWFIAREHRFTTGMAWSRGVLLRHRGAAANAWALLEDDDQAQPSIRLIVRGTEPHTFYSILNEGFTGILAERYPGLGVQQLIPCPCSPSPAPPCPFEFGYPVALRALERGAHLQCNESLESVDPRTLLLGLRSTSLEARLDQLRAQMDGMSAATARVERSQLLILDTTRDLLRHRSEQGAHCPSIFTVAKTGLTAYQLQLFCEQPDSPHPLPDGAGIYQLRELPRWLRSYAPYLRIILTGLKLAAPLAGPVLTGFAGLVLTEADQARLDLSCTVLEEIGGSAGVFAPQPEVPVMHVTADFTQLRAALYAIDPDWGGLRERELPENGGVVYLCREHREALRYPARTPPVGPEPPR